MASRRVGVILVLPLLMWLVGCDLDREIEKLLGTLAQTFWELGFERSEDPILVELTETVGRKVAEVSPRKDTPIKFRVLNVGEMNAVALPNGRIYVFRGMLETTDTEDELAAVLAHEVGHVAGRHSLKQFRVSLGINLLADLLNLNKRSRTIQSLAGIAATLYELGYSRQHERDADSYAFRLALLAGYDPQGSVALFDKFVKGEGKPARWLIYLSTHPPSTERLERAKRANADLGRIYPDLPAFAAHALVGAGYAQRGLYHQAALHYGKAVELQPQYLPALLGLAKAKEELGESGEASKLYGRVLEIDPKNETAKQGLEQVRKRHDESPSLETVNEKERHISLRWLEESLTEWERVMEQWAKQRQAVVNTTSKAASQVKALWSQMSSMPLMSSPISYAFGRSERKNERTDGEALFWHDAQRIDSLIRTQDEIVNRCAHTLAAFQITMAELESVLEDAQYATGLWVRALNDWQGLVAQGHKLPDRTVQASDSSSRILSRVAIGFERDAETVRDIERQITRALASLAEAANLLRGQKKSFTWIAETKLQIARSLMQGAESDLRSLLNLVKEKRTQVDKALLSAYQTRLSALEVKTPTPVVHKVASYHLRVEEAQIVSVREKTPDIGATALVIAFSKARKIAPEKLLAEIDFNTDWIGKLTVERVPSGVRVILRWMTNAWERDRELVDKLERQRAKPDEGEAKKDDEF
ncbi:MAG: M48 family metalloprotease [Candidatus Fervidibacter sp.]|uniref:M48 family metalloprotease n=1 Tax=Candidatus Fervidibacter sp. TaxID=3100871 RepID=UPI00404ACC9E